MPRIPWKPSGSRDAAMSRGANHIRAALNYGITSGFAGGSVGRQAVTNA